MPRLPRSRKARLAVFVATVIATILGVVMLSFAGSYLPLDDDHEQQYSEFDGIVPERVENTGRFTAEPASDSGVVLIDRSHGNRITSTDLQSLRTAITLRGWSIEYLDSPSNLDSKLSHADAFVVIDPESEYAQSDVDRIRTFVDNGGRLVLVGEPTRSVATLGQLSQATSRFGTLTTEFGIVIGDEYLYNMETNDGNFRNIIARGDGTPLADGVSTVALYTAAPVESVDGTPVLVGVNGTRSSTNRAPATYSVAVVDGNVLAVGDKSFLGSEQYRTADNEQFIRNMVRFLMTGDRERQQPDVPPVTGSRTPTPQQTPESGTPGGPATMTPST